MQPEEKKEIRIIAIIFLVYFVVYAVTGLTKMYLNLQDEHDRDERQLILMFAALAIVHLLPFVVLTYGLFKSRDDLSWDWGKIAAVFFLAICPSLWFMMKLFS